MTHNNIAKVYRQELNQRSIPLDEWDHIIYVFARKYNGKNNNIDEIVRCINEDIDQNK